MKKNEDASAFPWTIQEFEMSQPGLTKRELFAAMAMQGLLGNATYSLSYVADGRTFMGLCSRDSVELADALIAELAKEPNV